MTVGDMRVETPENTFRCFSDDDGGLGKAMQCIRKLEENLKEENEMNKLAVKKLERKLDQKLTRLDEVREKEGLVAEGMDLEVRTKQYNTGGSILCMLYV